MEHQEVSSEAVAAARALEGALIGRKWHVTLEQKEHRWELQLTLIQSLLSTFEARVPRWE